MRGISEVLTFSFSNNPIASKNCAHISCSCSSLTSPLKRKRIFNFSTPLLILARGLNPLTLLSPRHSVSVQPNRVQVKNPQSVFVCPQNLQRQTKADEDFPD